jgi:hypothetical protein
LLGPRFRRQARAFGAPPCGFGLDRSARPSKSGDRAANALHCNGSGNQSTYIPVGQRPTGRVLVFSIDIRGRDTPTSVTHCYQCGSFAVVHR